MRKLKLLCALVLAILLGNTSYAQDFSNKGKEFWFCFPNHIPSGANGQMSIWITSDQASSGTIVMTNGTFSANWNVAANGITSINIPYNLAHISNAESNMIIQKSLKISVNPGQPAIVAYCQQYGNARSAATLLLPTAVLGKKYRAASYTYTPLSAGGQNSRCQFQIIATRANSQVKVTPYSNGTAGAPFVLSFLNAGDMYQYQATSDVTSSLIESIAGFGISCLPIAVFSGSSASTIGTFNCTNPNSYDPLFQQLYPIPTWGKNYGFIPFGDYTNGNPYRIMASEDNTSVYMNGVFTANLNAGDIYPATYNITPVTLTQPTSITADKPICVIEYAQTSACSGTNNGDPDMVILNAIEQNIKDITIFASTQQNINRQWLNVLIPTVSAGSFKIDGAIPSTAFQVALNIPGYSYLQHQFVPAISGSHHLTADTGFNAICYGFQQGNFESYAYSAGTNVIDLTNGVSLETQYGTENNSACVGAPFKFKVYFPDSTLGSPPVAIRFDSLKWDLSNSAAISPNNFPVMQVPPVIDSTRIILGRQVNWYSLPGFYNFISAGANTLTITAYRSTNEGCGNEQSYDFQLQIYDPPAGSFSWTTSSGCSTQPVQFTETTPQVPKPTYRFWWDFGDPASGPANNSNLRNPTHLFSGSGTYTVKYVGITTPGCLLDTISHQVTVNDPPSANFSVTGPFCVNDPVSFIDNSNPGPGATINKWTWNFGDGSPIVIVFAPNPPNQVHPYTIAGTYNATLVVETTTGCPSLVYTWQIIIGPSGTINLTSPPGTDNQTVCINTSITNITYAVGGGVTGGNVTGLPAGVTGTYAAGVITIAGTPTVSGVFNYSITTTGACVNPIVSGTITVTADGTLTLTSGAGTDNQTVCINTPIVTIIYSVGGSGTGGNVTGLPAGVTGTFAGGVITISGIPSVSGIFNFTVNTTGPCIIPTASGRIIVTGDGTLTLTSAPGTNNQTVCINTPIINITYAVGGTGTGGNVSGLPAGVTGTFAGGVITITGTPTVAGTYNYTVTTTGPCVTPSANGTITVTADGTLTLTSAPGTDNQTVCINTPIVTIIYSVGGSGTGGNVTGLPAGVTGTFAGGVITISGIPSVSGIFNFTVNTTGPCIIPTASGRIIVTGDGTLTLTSAPGTNNQTVCINTPIINITYAVGGTGTGGNVSGLPAGVTGTFAGGVITITGTPTVAGTYNYTVTTTGPCVTPSANGTITVTADGTLTLTSAPGTDNQTVCINTPIVTIIYSVGGSGTGGNVTGLPAGVTGTFAGGVITISGIPSVSGIFNFTVNTTGPCIIPTASGRIIVTGDGTLTLTSAPGTNNQTVCINTPIINITYAVGGTGTGGNVSGLPAGVTGTFAGGVITITGTPTVAGTYNYTVTTTGPCVMPSANGTITVTSDGTLTLTSAPGTDNQNACINNPIIPITYAVGGSGTGGSVSGLPAGVTATFAGGIITISGAPTVSGVFNYTVTTTGPCVTPTANGRITITAVATITLTSAPGTDNQTVCINTPIINITYLVGGSGTGANFAGLPAGVTGNFAGGIVTISGSPAVVGTFNYSVNTTGPCGTPSANGTITVNDNSTLTLSSGPGSNIQTVCINTPIAIITYAVGGGGTGASITAGALPAGVSGVYAGGVFTITGTPTASGVFNFTITTAGPCINPNATGRITVTADGTLTLTSAPGTTNQTVCVNTPIINITYAVGGSGTGGSVSGLPAGVTGTFAAGVITISGSPSVAGTFNYTVTTTGPCVMPSANGTITVNDNSTLTLTSGVNSNIQSVCINTPINNITYAIGGGGTGVSITLGGLPPGVTGVYSGGVFTISGTPTVLGLYNYTITTTGPCNNPSATGLIFVRGDGTIALTSAPGTTNQTVCVNTPIVNITYAIGGTVTFGSVTGLPAGVNGNYSPATQVLTISGTPSVSGVFNYTVTTVGQCVEPTATGTITVNDNSTINLTSGPGSNVQTVCINTAITNITYAVAGSGTGASITAGALPAGVSGSYNGGVFTISGTPTVSGIFNFTITTTGPCVNPTANGTITVTADGTITLTSAPGTTNQTVCINTPIINITYSVGGSGTGGSVSGLPAGVTGTFAGGVITITGTPSVPGTFNYTVTTTGPCVKPSANGTITVNDNSTISLSSGPGSNVQTVCINTPVNNITYAIGGGGTGASITAGSLPAGLSGSYSGGVFTISGSPTASGTFNFTVGTTGPCVNTSQSGTITVTADATLTLTSAAGTNNQTICVNTPITNIRYAIGGSGINASITAGSLPAGVNGVFAGGVFTISGIPTVSGIFNYTVGSTGPCMNPTLTGTLTINPDHTINLSSAASTTNQTVCLAKPITSVVYALGGGATGATVTGLPAGVTYSVSGNTLTISGSPSSLAGSPYNFSIITTGNSCIRALASGSISVLPAPFVQFDPVAGICADAPSFIVTSVIPLGAPPAGVFSGPGISAAGLFNPAAAGAGDHIIRYTFTNANGCSNFQEQTISVFPLPPTNAGPDKFMLEGGQVMLTPTLVLNMPVTYLWTPAQYLTDPNIATPVANPPFDFTYLLRITSDKGCSDTSSVFVKVLKPVFIPNIFSPNGDGIHDTWVIQYLDTYPGSTVDIYNRYGQHIYHSEGYTKPWDGTINGNPVPVGTYYYIVNPKNGRKIMSGYVDVIR